MQRQAIKSGVLKWKPTKNCIFSNTSAFMKCLCNARSLFFKESASDDEWRFQKTSILSRKQFEDIESQKDSRPTKSLLGGPAYINCRDEKSKHKYRMVLSLNMKKDRFMKKEELILIWEETRLIIEFW